jgi:hypothetical protein
MKKAVIITCVGIVLAYWGVSLGRSLAPSTNGLVSIHSAAEEDIRFTPAPKPRDPSSVKPEPSAGTANPVAPAVTAPKIVNFEFQAELDAYVVLKSIVLPTEEQKQERSRLLANGRLLSALGARLVKQPLLDLSEQDVAVDILLDALKDGDSVAAEAALKTVVEDQQVEDLALDRPIREQLAGVKAEVLYQWAAMAPSSASSLAALLPGPTSQKIWQNVLKSHERNLAEQ